MRTRLPILLFATSIALVPSAAAQVFRAKDLGVLPTGESSHAFSINDGGAVAGVSELTGTAETRAFRYENGVMINLGLLPCGGTHSFGRGINDQGHVAATAICPGLTGGWRPALHDGTTMIDLGFGAVATICRDINDRGWVVGAMDINQSVDGRLITHAVLYDGTRAVDLGTLGGLFSKANGINDGGQVVGGAHTQGNAAYHAVLWDNGAATDLGTLGGRNSEAWDIDDRGRIVGWADDPSGARRAFLLAGGSLTDLGTLGGRISEARAINARTWVVGRSFNAEDRMRAFLHPPHGSGMVALQDRIVGGDPFVALQAAEDVNTEGQIVGWGRTPSGKTRAFRLDPIRLTISSPSPGTPGQLNTLDIEGASPGEPVFVVAGRLEGSTPLPGCQGESLDIGDPRILGSVLPAADGKATFQVFVPAALQNVRVLLQTVDYSSCRVSPRIEHQF